MAIRALFLNLVLIHEAITQFHEKISYNNEAALLHSEFSIFYWSWKHWR